MMQSGLRMTVRWAFNFHKWEPTRDEWTMCNQCIQQEERNRIQKFVFKKDAKSSMAGRLMMRKALVNHYGKSNKEIQLARTDKGKPYLVGHEKSGGFSFNVSHQGQYSVLAAQDRCFLGVDVMQLESRNNIEEFFHNMRRQFTEEEWIEIRHPNSAMEQLEVFLRLWCLKESYVKALGIGIGFEVKRLNFMLKTKDLKACTQANDTELKVDDKHLNDWSFEEEVLDNHCIAVAVNNTKESNKNKNQMVSDVGVTPSNNSSKFKVLTLNDLIQGMDVLNDEDFSYWDNFLPKHENPQGLRNKDKS